MVDYALHFVDANGRRFAADTIEAASDATAIDYACFRYCRRAGFPRFELWNGSRLVFDSACRTKPAGDG